MLLRLAYLTVTNTFAALRLLPMSDRDKDIEILALRHQITVLERQLGADTKVRFAPEDRAFLAALLTSLPARSCAGYGSSSARTPSCAGTAI
ncbi:hypothetical protein [Nonomuraea insulae]|uniref:Uncharacterized protein n=1 Tax=Nonomuraea insulae TaxID=1616787 RepID=A0ABW1CS98_9ACTN